MLHLDEAVPVVVPWLDEAGPVVVPWLDKAGPVVVPPLDHLRGHPLLHLGVILLLLLPRLILIVRYLLIRERLK